MCSFLYTLDCVDSKYYFFWLILNIIFFGKNGEKNIKIVNKNYFLFQ